MNLTLTLILILSLNMRRNERSRSKNLKSLYARLLVKEEFFYHFQF